MKQDDWPTMTSAEFAKANIAAINGPVRIRRYTKLLGIYYPEGFSPAEPRSAQLALEDPIKTTKADLLKQIESLEEDNRHLKKLLAARTEAVKTTSSLPPPSKLSDPFATLPKQDREFFERKLGKKK